MDNNTEKKKKKPLKTKEKKKILKPLSFAFKPDNHFKNFIDEFFDLTKSKAKFIASSISIQNLVISVDVIGKKFSLFFLHFKKVELRILLMHLHFHILMLRKMFDHHYNCLLI